MTDNIIRTYYKDGRTEERPMTAEEIAERDALAAEITAYAQQREAEEEAKESARQAGLAKLIALGLTEAEAQAIIG